MGCQAESSVPWTFYTSSLVCRDPQIAHRPGWGQYSIPRQSLLCREWCIWSFHPTVYRLSQWMSSIHHCFRKGWCLLSLSRSLSVRCLTSRHGKWSSSNLQLAETYRHYSAGCGQCWIQYHWLWNTCKYLGQSLQQHFSRKGWKIRWTTTDSLVHLKG